MRGPVRILLVSLLVLATGVGAATDSSVQSGLPRADPVRGMTVSTPRGSSVWGSDAMVATIGELAALGVNWIAIHPYARIERDGEVRWRSSGADAESADGPSWLRRPIQEAHRRGVKILVKPHLAHWGRFEWRGAIEFEEPAAWQRFFATYRRWIVSMARFAHDADAFAVGTELDRTIGHEQAWREIIAAIREVNGGSLTYAANWTDFERVPFWDALDSIGIQAYFPLVDDGDRNDPAPSQARLDAGWETIMRRLRHVSSLQQRPILFTELGYNRSDLAPYEPWDYRASGGDQADLLQERCMRAALAAIAAEPAVLGAFLWKWFPGDSRPRDFEMSSPAMRALIREYWVVRPRP